MDTSAFASTGGQGQQTPQPATGQQQLNNGTAPGGVAAMIKAIMDGNDAYKAQQKPASYLAPGSAVPGAQGLTSVSGGGGPPMPIMGGGPTPPAPAPMPAPPPMPGPSNATGMAPPSGAPMVLGGGMAPQLPQDPFATGAPPIPGMGMAQTGDPVAQALMSPIPGM